MSYLEDAIRACIAHDAEALEQEQQAVDATELVRMHLVPAQQLEETSEEEIHALPGAAANHTGKTSSAGRRSSFLLGQS